jgi:hypothetical protein
MSAKRAAGTPGILRSVSNRVTCSYYCLLLLKIAYHVLIISRGKNNLNRSNFNLIALKQWENLQFSLYYVGTNYSYRTLCVAYTTVHKWLPILFYSNIRSSP